VKNNILCFVLSEFLDRASAFATITSVRQQPTASAQVTRAPARGAEGLPLPRDSPDDPVSRLTRSVHFVVAPDITSPTRVTWGGRLRSTFVRGGRSISR